MQRLSGKRVVITGAAQGLGQALAQRCADEGASVVIGDMNMDGATQTAKQVGGSAYLLDVADYTGCEAFMKQAADTLGGGIDILVCNAAIVFSGGVDEIEADKWKKVIDVNLCGFFNTVKAAAPYMGEGSSILQINSKSGKKGSFKNSAYAASKFGGIGLVQSLALEFAPQKIRVNAICPGNLLDSPLWVNSLYAMYAKNQGITEQQVRQKYVDQVPLKRGCTYEDVANVLVFLSSEEASYMTGQAINVTGGQQMT